MVGVLDELPPLYHEYSFFGVSNKQCAGIYALNQKSKSPIITAYIALAIAKSRVHAEDDVSFVELFCADGYYAMVAARLGCTMSYGVDSNRDGHLTYAPKIAELLGIKSMGFAEHVLTRDSIYEADIVANIGGLYHVEDPEGVLVNSYNNARKFLIIQNVVSLAEQDEDYYESPAPGWTWGNRYSRKSFDKLVRRCCPKVVDCHFNELEGNSRMEDRGSAYYLIEK